MVLGRRGWRPRGSKGCLPLPASPILTYATTPTLSLCAGLWLTPHIQGSGSGQQTPSQLGGCPEELMQP
ncbi:hypothetical protein NQZ68_017403 [Dissostichus eleginoides]|nr:hypothetical protein NQZ68_017403 [Dissostichus eleginoides]